MTTYPTYPSITHLLRRLWRHIGQRRRVQLGLLFVLMILASAAEVVSIGAVLPFLGALTQPDWIYAHRLAQPFVRVLELTEPGQLLLPLSIAFALAVLVSGALRLLLLWGQIRLGHSIGADLSINIYRRTLYQPYAVHVARNSSEVISGVRGKANSVVGTTIMPILTIASSAFLLIAILVALLAIEPVIALVAFAGFGSIYLLVMAVSRRRLAHDSRQMNVKSTQVVKALQEGLGGIRDVLIDGTQATYCTIYQEADLPLRRAEASVVFIGLSPRYGIEALGMLLIAALALLMSKRADGITAAIPVLGALALGAQRLMPVLQQAYAGWTSMRGGQASLSDALDLMDQHLPEYANAPQPARLPFRQRIELSNISFRYTPQTPWVLRDLSLQIPHGSRIGFVGSTGSGKSTLLDIVMGLLYATEGQMSIDGVAVTAKNCRGWQLHIAHVPQAIFLADTTIAENIAFGVPADEVDYARVRDAARKAQIAQTIESWEHQYNTVVGERGVRLSGGQRQRIGIARALYKQADVIVFDEATSALDNETERAVMQAIESLGDEITILIVAHRLTTLRQCTQIVELCEGRVHRAGTYADIVGESN